MMEDVIELKSRGDDTNYLKKLKKPDGSESKTYTLKVSYPVITVGYLPNGKMYIQPFGSSIIAVGERLNEADAIVKSINYTNGYGYSITFF